MFKKKRANDPYPHVKYTKHAIPYVDADDELLRGGLGKELHEQMKLISSFSKSASDSSEKKATDESSWI